MTNHQPMTNDELRYAAPSIFAAKPWHKMSEKYAFIPTITVVERMRAEGFLPVDAVQSKTRVEGKGEFTKHMVKFRDVRAGDQPLTTHLGRIYPELLLTNAHDGLSAYKLHSGAFRFICGNGLVAGDNIVSHINVPHRGNPDGVIDATFEIVDEMPKMIESIENFSALRLEAGEQRAFGAAALALRYDEGEAPITAEMVVAPRRSEDLEPTLWNTFNTAQERLVNGGDRYRTEARVDDGGKFRPSRRMRTRAVQGISENTRLNQALWTLAEEMRKLRG